MNGGYRPEPTPATPPKTVPDQGSSIAPPCPSFTFSAREKRGDKPDLDSETLMKIAIERYGAFPEWQGPVATAMRQHQMAQVQLMLDAIRKVTDATKMQYVIDLEVQLAAANWKIAMIQQAVNEFAARADTP